MARVVVGSVFSAGTVQVGQTFLYLNSENLDSTKKEKHSVMEIDIAVYTANHTASETILILNPNISKLSSIRLKIIILPQKIKSDGAMSIRKVDILLKYTA